jgi:hypothetical protein
MADIVLKPRMAHGLVLELSVVAEGLIVQLSAWNHSRRNSYIVLIEAAVSVAGHIGRQTGFETSDITILNLAFLVR